MPKQRQSAGGKLCLKKILNPITHNYINDYTGQQYNEWTVIGLSPRNTCKKTKWVCKCSCGTIKDLYVASIVNGLSKSCGCLREVQDLRNRVFGRLVVKSMVRATTGRRKIYWECLCSCGNTVFVETGNLISGSTISCGCYKQERLSKVAYRHGHGRERIYKNFLNMHQRCENPNSLWYKNYGARGIFVCDEWSDFQTFYEWAQNNGYQRGLTLDRIDVDGPYAPWNCRWATSFQQGNNRRNTIRITYNGITKTISEWANETGIKRSIIYSKYKKGLTPEEILKER